MLASTTSELGGARAASAGSAPAASASASGAATPGPSSSAAPAPSAPAHAQTRWEPFEREAARVADGSLDVCTTAVFPLAILPGIGDVVGTIGEWVCLVPAAIAVDYAGAFHGGRDSDFWQPALALVVKKGWETLLDTPIMVVTIAAVIGSVAGGVALNAWAGVPATVVSAGVFGATAAVYLGLKAGRDGVGDFLFDVFYDGLTPEAADDRLEQARRSSWLQPGMTGLPAAFGMVATVSGSKPRFDWRYAVPVVGPVWRADTHARDIQQQTRRFGREVLLVDKKDLAGVDGISGVLAGVQGYSNAVAHVAIGSGLALFGAGVAVSLDEQNANRRTTAELLGGIGLGTIGVGGLALVTGIAADRLQPVLVPAAWALAKE